MASLALIDEAAVNRVFLEVLNLARNLARAARSVKLGNLAHSGSASLDRCPCSLLAIAVGAEHSDTGDHYFLHFLTLSLKFSFSLYRFGQVQNVPA